VVVPTTRPRSSASPTGPGRPDAPRRRRPVIRIAAGIGAAFGALTVVARWIAGHAPAPADDFGYQLGRVIGGAIFYGIVGVIVGVIIRATLFLGRHRSGR